jgi:hypothetical protein
MKFLRDRAQSCDALARHFQEMRNDRLHLWFRNRMHGGLGTTRHLLRVVQMKRFALDAGMDLHREWAAEIPVGQVYVPQPTNPDFRFGGGGSGGGGATGDF